MFWFHNFVQLWIKSIVVGLGVFLVHKFFLVVFVAVDVVEVKSMRFFSNAQTRFLVAVIVGLTRHKVQGVSDVLAGVNPVPGLCGFRGQSYSTDMSPSIEESCVLLAESQKSVCFLNRLGFSESGCLLNLFF